MFIVRAFVGIGEAAVMPLALALLSDARSDARSRNRSFGIFFTSPLAGQAAALLFGGALVQALPAMGGLQPWQSVFLIAGGCGLLPIAAILIFMPEPARQPAVRADREVGAWGVVLSHGRLASVLFVGMSLLQVGYVAGLTWDVVILQRTYGWSAGTSGMALALTACPLAMIGSLVSVRIVARLRRAGYLAAPLLVGIGASVVFAILTTAGLLLSAAGPSLGLLALGFFFGPPSSVCGFIALSESLPPPVRARLGGVNTIANSAICNTAGAYAVGFLGDRLFTAQAGIGRAVAVTGATATALGAIVVCASISTYIRRQREVGRAGGQP